MARQGLIAVATATLALTLIAPSLAVAQGTDTGNPFAPGLPAPPATTPTTTTPPVITTPSTSTSGGGLSGGGAVAIAIGAIVLLGGISLFIWRDARRRAPVKRHTAAIPEEGGRGGSKARAKPRKLSPAERRRRKRGRAR